MYDFRLFGLSIALLMAFVSYAPAQTNEDIANRLLIDAVTGRGGASDPLYQRRLLSALVEEYPESAAAQSVASGVVSLPDLPETPEWQQMLIAGSVITGYSHGDFPAFERERTHPGFDIGLHGQGDCGLPVIAPLSGTVVRAVARDVPDDDLAQIGIDRALNDRDLQRNTGNAVILRHDDGDQVTYSIYLHLSETPANADGVPWRVEMTIPAGERIGTVGETGAAVGCHLHFEARRFEGTRKYLHPVYDNIYPLGDISETDVFAEDWIAPETFLRRAFITRHLGLETPTTPTVIAIPEAELPGAHAESTPQFATTGVLVAEAAELESAADDWIETNEARRTIGSPSAIHSTRRAEEITGKILAVIQRLLPISHRV